METLPCRKCAHDVVGQPPRCPYCGTRNPLTRYGPAMEAKAQAIVVLFSLAVCGGVAILILLLSG